MILQLFYQLYGGLIYILYNLAIETSMPTTLISSVPLQGGTLDPYL